MLDYVVPSGVRIADASRVRLGAHLAAGTTVMHEGFCNYNAGTLGASMVEGRISAGVVVGDGSDVGGGASIMGTLSGGMQKRVALAVALVSGPDVLLLDEPTNHLDFTSIQWLEGLLREFRGSVLFITHDLRLVRGFAERCYVMQDHRPVEVPDPMAPTVPPVLAALRAAILPAHPRPRAEARPLA